jgi:multimeric flavodoxin WrbA
MHNTGKKPLAVGIAGSPRPAGNSTALLKAYLEGASDTGFETELVHLNRLLYRGCQGCDRCVKGLECGVHDELNDVFPLMKRARVWALASPVYYDGMSGQLKTFFDRLHFTTHDPHKLTGPRRGIVIVTYEDNRRDYYREMASHLAEYFNWNKRGDFGRVEVVAEPNLGPAGAWKNRPGLLENLKNIGQRQAEELLEIFGKQVKPRRETEESHE